MILNDIEASSSDRIPRNAAAAVAESRGGNGTIARQQTILAGLNPQQIEAVKYDHTKSVLVVAGPGSGKTRVVSHRVAWLISQCGVDPSHIVAVTFTNKAANELKNRVARMIGGHQAQQITLFGTFHSICAKILRQSASSAIRRGLNRHFTIIDAEEQESIVLKLVEASLQDQSVRQYLNLSATKSKANSASQDDIEKSKKQFINECIGTISRCKNYRQGPINAAAFEEMVRNGETINLDPYGDPSAAMDARLAIAISVIYSAYEKHLCDKNQLDFDDLLLCTVQLFKQNTAVREYYATKCRALLVDEWQDSNTLQYRLCQHLGSVHKSIFVVGDDDQSIYQWRFANRNVTQFFMEDFDATIIKLEQNYRSTKNIIAASNAVIGNTKGNRIQRTMRTDNCFGPPVSLCAYESDTKESTSIIDEIDTLLNTPASKLKKQDFAILVRTNAQTRTFEDALNLKQIPYRVLGTLKFWKREEIRDILALLRLVDDTSNDIAFEQAFRVLIPEHRMLLRVEESAKTRKCTFFEASRALANTAEANNASSAAVPSRSNSRPAAPVEEAEVHVTALINFVDTVEQLSAMKDRDALPSEIVKQIVELTQYRSILEKRQRASSAETVESKMQNVEELINVCVEFEQRDAEHSAFSNNHNAASSSDEKPTCKLHRFLNSIKLAPSEDSDQKNDDVVTLSTIHSAKGLEFGVVFVPSLEQGSLPFFASLQNPIKKEEQRRVLFVAMTRAKAMLYLSWAKQRHVAGRVFYNKESEFLWPLKSCVKVPLSKVIKQSGWLEINSLLGSTQD